MFSGLVQTQGTIRQITPLAGGLEYQIVADFGPEAKLEKGESICTQGVCLTVTEVLADGYTAQVMPETLRVTTLGEKKPGDRVNLERALQLSDRIGGHLVSGHVDCLATVTRLEQGKKWVELQVEYPLALAAEIARKGSICLDGVSLTVTQVGSNPEKEKAWLEVALIPLTQSETTLGQLKIGSHLNLETDLVAKYVAQAARTISSSLN